MKSGKSFAEVKPELLAEWSDRNFSLTHEDYSYASGKKVWWKGKCGHEWQASIKNRVLKNSGNKVLKGYNDFASNKPELASEWSPKNYPMKPDEFTTNSPVRVCWKGKCGHEWSARIADRVEGSGCPYCARNGKMLVGFNDLAHEHPELALEWSDKNGNLKADSVKSNLDRKVWWKCRECDYEWQAVIRSRVRGKNKCPVCNQVKLLKGVNDLTITDKDISEEWSKKNNRFHPEDFVRTSGKKVIWKCSKCGNEWKAKIKDRVNGNVCPSCRAVKILRYYLHKAGIKYLVDYTELTGLAFQTYLPEIKALIEFSVTSDNSDEKFLEIKVKSYICLKLEIRYIRILNSGDREWDKCICIRREDDSDETLTLILKIIFRMNRGKC